ncbi:MAG: alpha/beta hydrolase [Candidatus Promineifilaceae bacterium]
MPFQPTYDVPDDRQAYAVASAEREGWERIAVLMLHGFMGSPASSRPMAEFLAAHGVTVRCPLLPGHGNLPYQIRGSSHQDWIAEVLEAYDCLQQEHDQVFLVGHSMGAVLSAQLATHAKGVCGLVLIAPLYEIPDRRLKVAAVGRYFLNYVYPLKYKSLDPKIWLGRVLDYNPNIDVEDPALQEWLIEASRIPVDGVAEMSKMAGIGRRLWPQVHQPVLIFQGGQDPAVNPGNTEKLFQSLATVDKEMKFFPQAGHELMRPVEPIHHKVWQKTLEFIEDHAEIGNKVPTALNAPSLLARDASE